MIDIFNKIRCFIFRPYQIKPRFLPYTWVDRDDVLVHVMFEVLCDFIEKEGEYTVWDYDEDVEAVWKRMKQLRDWWLNRRQDYDDVYEILLKKYSETEETIYSDAYIKIQRMYERDLSDKLHEIVKLRKYLWT